MEESQRFHALLGLLVELFFHWILISALLILITTPTPSLAKIILNCLFFFFIQPAHFFITLFFSVVNSKNKEEKHGKHKKFWRCKKDRKKQWEKKANKHRNMKSRGKKDSKFRRPKKKGTQNFVSTKKKKKKKNMAVSTSHELSLLRCVY